MQGLQVRSTHHARQALQAELAAVGKGDDGTCCEEAECGFGGDQVEIDPGLAQCCIKDREDSEKARRYKAAMKSVDPVAKVERLVEETRKVSLSSGCTGKEWIAQAARQAQQQVDANAVRERQSEEEEEEEGDEQEELDSDAELDAFLDDFQPTKNFDGNDEGEDSNNTTLQDEKPVFCALPNQVAAFLAQPVKKVAIKFVLFRSSRATELSDRLGEDLGRIQLASALMPFQARVAIADFDLLGESHPLFRSRWFVEKSFPFDPPFVVAFSNRNLQVQFAFARVDLERATTSSLVDTWWQTYSFNLKNNHSNGSDDEDEDYENAFAMNEVSSSYCNRPGCPRTFPHEHVQRMKKQAEW